MLVHKNCQRQYQGIPARLKELNNNSLHTLCAKLDERYVTVSAVVDQTDTHSSCSHLKGQNDIISPQTTIQILSV